MLLLNQRRFGWFTPRVSQGDVSIAVRIHMEIPCSSSITEARYRMLMKQPSKRFSGRYEISADPHLSLCLLPSQFHFYLNLKLINTFVSLIMFFIYNNAFLINSIYKIYIIYLQKLPLYLMQNISLKIYWFT